MSRFVPILALLVCGLALCWASPIVRLQDSLIIGDSPIPFTSCGTSSDLVTLTSVTANNWPPIKGADLVITAVGTLSQAVTGGTYEIKAVFLGIPILDQKGDLSELVTLPLAAGPITISKTENLPSITPSGTINIQINANDDQGHELVCLKIVATIKKEASPAIIHQRTPLMLNPIAWYNNVNVPFTTCGSSAAKMPVTSISASQWPPTPGSTVALQSIFEAKEVVTGGTQEAVVEYLGIVLQDKTGSLADAGFVLPIAVGKYTLASSLEVPAALPSGTITDTLTGKDSAGNELFCVKISFTV